MFPPTTSGAECPTANCANKLPKKATPRPVRYGDEITLTTSPEWAYGKDSVEGKVGIITKDAQYTLNERNFCVPRVDYNSKTPEYGTWEIVPVNGTAYKGHVIRYDNDGDGGRALFKLKYKGKKCSGYDGQYVSPYMQMVPDWTHGSSNTHDGEFYFSRTPSMKRYADTVGAKTIAGYGASDIVMYGDVLNIVFIAGHTTQYIWARNKLEKPSEPIPGYGFGGGTPIYLVTPWAYSFTYPNRTKSTGSPENDSWGNIETDYVSDQFIVWPKGMVGLDEGVPDACKCNCDDTEGEFKYCPSSETFSKCVYNKTKDKYEWEDCEKALMCDGTYGRNVCWKNPGTCPGATTGFACCDAKTQTWRCRDPAVKQGITYSCPNVAAPTYDSSIPKGCTDEDYTCRLAKGQKAPANGQGTYECGNPSAPQPLCLKAPPKKNVSVGAAVTGSGLPSATAVITPLVLIFVIALIMLAVKRLR